MLCASLQSVNCFLFAAGCFLSSKRQRFKPQAPHHGNVWVGGGLALRILNLDDRWRWVVSFTRHLRWDVEEIYSRFETVGFNTANTGPHCVQFSPISAWPKCLVYVTHTHTHLEFIPPRSDPRCSLDRGLGAPQHRFDIVLQYLGPLYTVSVLVLGCVWLIRLANVGHASVITSGSWTLEALAFCICSLRGGGSVHVFSTAVVNVVM